MTRPTRDASIRLGLVMAAVAAVAAVLVTLFGPEMASATEDPGAQIRMGVHRPQTQVVVGTHDGINVGRRLESSPPTYDSVLAAGAAAENPVAAALGVASECNYDGAAPSYDASVLPVDARTVVQVEAVGRQAKVVPLRRQVDAASEGSVGISGFVVAAEGGGRIGSALVKSEWPANRGFLGKSVETTLKAGTRVDRYGGTGGTFASPEGTAFGARSLRSTSINSPHNVYEVAKPVTVQGGTVAPGLGYGGGGIQYEFGSPIQDLLESGVLKRVGP